MAKVLLVDDHRIVTLALKHNIDYIGGYDVVGVAHDGGEVLEQIFINKPDIVILDVQLPTIGGDELLPIIKKTSHCKVFMLTGSNNRYLWGRLIKEGADGLAVKSISSEELKVGLDKIMIGEKFVHSYILDSVSDFNEGILLKIPAKKRERLSLIERQYVVLESSCLSENVIADRLNVAVPHLFDIRRSIMSKLGIKRDMDFKSFFL